MNKINELYIHEINYNNTTIFKSNLYCFSIKIFFYSSIQIKKINELNYIDMLPCEESKYF
jgi:hypothetical protein